MKSILIEVYVTVKNSGDAKEIADDIHTILNDAGITNSVNVTDEESS